MSTFINGDIAILSIHDGTAYLPVACLTSNSLSETTNIIESQTKCDPQQIIRDAGSRSYEISAEGKYIDTTSVTGETARASHDKLRGFQGTTVTWRLSTGLADTEFYYGTAIISDLEMTADAGDELINFSTTFMGSGLIATVDPII